MNVTGTVDGPPAPWVEVSTEEGRVYYHNTVTDETSWKMPQQQGAGSVVTSVMGVGRDDSIGGASSISEWSHYDLEHRDSTEKLSSLSAIRANIKQKLDVLTGLQRRMDKRLAYFKRADEVSDAEDYKEIMASEGTCTGRWKLKREFKAMVKAQQKEIEAAVALAVLPRRMHLAAEHQQKIIDGFTGRLG